MMRLTHAEPVVTHETALLTDIDLERIGRNHETFEEKLGSSVSDETITLHLS